MTATRVVTIVFRFAAVCLLLRLVYQWISYLLAVQPNITGDQGSMREMMLEGMLRGTVVTVICAVALYLVAPFLGKLVTKGSE